MNFSIPLQPAEHRPLFIGDAIARLEYVVTHEPWKLLELHGSEGLPRWQQKRIVTRQRKFLENFVKVMKAMLERHELESGRVGRPRSDGHVTPPGQQGTEGHEREAGLVADTGLSITQLRRVIYACTRAGYLLGPRRGPDGRMLVGPSGKRYQRVKEYTDTRTGKIGYKACRVVYVLTDLFFERLGKKISERRELERADAARRRAERRARMYPGPLLAARENLRGMRHGSRETRHHGAPGAPTSVGAPEAPERRTYPDGIHPNSVHAVMLGLRNKHPDWGRPRLEAEALALLRGLRSS